MLPNRIALPPGAEQRRTRPRKGKCIGTAAFGGLAANSLALPGLGAIQSSLRSITDRSKWATLALLWMDAGYIDEDAPLDDAHKLVQGAVSRWVQEHCGQVQYLGFEFSVGCTPESILGGYSPFLDPLDGEADLWFFWTTASGAPWRILRPRLEALEAACPGLAEKILYGMDLAAWRAHVPLLTPSTLRAMYSHVAWYGLDTQEEWLEEMVGMGAEEEQLEGSLSPKLFDESIPERVSSPAKKGFNARALRALAKRSTPEVAEVATCLADIAKAVEGNNALLNCDMQYTELETATLTAVLQWDPDDVTERAVHDIDYTHGQYENATDITGIEAVPLDAAGFKEWLERRSHVLRLIHNIDRLIGLVSVPLGG